jgi:membrane protein DedA with SNARE-associated domain
LGSDLLVYTIGRRFGKKIVKTKFFKKNIGQERFDKINKLFQKYGHWACGIFRFTPGVRFPGHLSCGIMEINVWKFLIVDGFAALISVPSQVVLVAIYGEIILDKIAEFKIIIGIIVLIIILFYVSKKIFQYYQRKRVS